MVAEKPVSHLSTVSQVFRKKQWVAVTRINVDQLFYRPRDTDTKRLTCLGEKYDNSIIRLDDK